MSEASEGYTIKAWPLGRDFEWFGLHGAAFTVTRDGDPVRRGSAHGWTMDAAMGRAVRAAQRTADRHAARRRAAINQAYDPLND